MTSREELQRLQRLAYGRGSTPSTGEIELLDALQNDSNQHAGAEASNEPTSEGAPQAETTAEDPALKPSSTGRRVDGVP